MRYQLPVLEEIKAIKSSKEIGYIIQAQRISEAVLRLALGKLKSGIREIELARYIVAEFKRRGAKALAFPPIVSFGKNSAEIHHEPGNSRLKRGDLVMFDLGCAVNGYCSDMSRTYILGKPTSRQKRVYLVVLEAQKRALQKLEKGERRAKVVDASARQFLHKRFGKKSFTHGLGHGVGTAIHECPSFKPGCLDIIKPGTIMTVEPGVYFKNWGGIRIEDMILVGRRGVKNLTKAPKEIRDIIINAPL